MAGIRKKGNAFYCTFRCSNTPPVCSAIARRFAVDVVENRRLGTRSPTPPAPLEITGKHPAILHDCQNSDSRRAW